MKKIVIILFSLFISFSQSTLADQPTIESEIETKQTEQTVSEKIKSNFFEKAKAWITNKENLKTIGAAALAGAVAGGLGILFGNSSELRSLISNPEFQYNIFDAVVKGAAVGGLSGGAAAVSAQQSTDERLSENDRKIAIVVGALGGFQVGRTNPIECVITPKDGPTFFYNNQNGPVILDRPFNISGEEKIN